MINSDNDNTKRPPRFVTAASLFDGHDASINIMRRILQSNGVEVIHLAHNRSVAEVVETALQEDAHAIAISSYQGGHVEYFKYMIDMLKQRNASHIKVFGGGGGVIVADEIAELHTYGVEKIYSPQDGMNLGLVGMIKDMIKRSEPANSAHNDVDKTMADWFDEKDQHRALAQLISMIELGDVSQADREQLALRAQERVSTPVLGITGTGGAGKSSLTDEIIRRFRIDSDNQASIAILAIDPTRRKTGGALLGDRIRMNSIYHHNIYMRSLATRDASGEVPGYLTDVINAVRCFNFDLVVVETPGIGQGDAGIVPYVDSSMYVMTPEFGAQSQLEKIDMLDFADLVVINKFDRTGAADAQRDVAKQLQRNREAWGKRVDEMPVYGSIASRFGDDGVTSVYRGLLEVLREQGLREWSSNLLEAEQQAGQKPGQKTPSEKTAIIPASRKRYLAEISETVRAYLQHADQQANIAGKQQALKVTKELLTDAPSNVIELHQVLSQQLDAESTDLLSSWADLVKTYQGKEQVSVLGNGKTISTKLVNESLSGLDIPRVCVPKYQSNADLLKWLKRENLPGYFPFTAGVFPFKREGEDPARMFAGEGGPKRTNQRFKKLSEHSDAKRLSTAFDSVTLYGFDPNERPDIYGKVGNSGVSIATQDDMNELFDGFDLCAPSTSVSMTINGPAPAILAMFLNTAITQQLDKFEQSNGRKANTKEAIEIKANTLNTVRGTVQADILKEDQGQNTCIFSTEFSLRMMGDIQQYFIDNQVRNFYSVSISGYHIAEAGANPITQLAFTLANGFTFVEGYLARGMCIDDFAHNLSFFFSNGMDPEYTVIGRVARRIWAVTMRDKYGANSRSQRLKYHVQTSGRSLHAQEMQFNDIRTTLQALLAVNDNCNSLHTNAYDEAITTPSEESVRRALAIQLIINREFGLAKNENPSQGSFVVQELTDLVEEAVLQEFERISDRGGVLGAMETGYQRGKIQEESIKYETMKHDGSYPLIGVNTFLPEHEEAPEKVELARSTDQEKQDQIERLQRFHEHHAEHSEASLTMLKQTILDGGNGFDALMDAVEHCSLGQLTDAFFEVGGQYRRST